MLKTPEEYVESLRELDPVVYMKGKRVESVPDEPMLEPGINAVSVTYEFALLQVLAERAGRVLSRDQLLCLAKGNPEEAFDRSIDGHISRIRKKLGDDPQHPKLLKTIRGAGYMLVTEEA